MSSLTFNALLDGIRSEYVLHLSIVLAIILALRTAHRIIYKRPRATRLGGPSGGFFGAERILFETYHGDVYEAWHKEHGPVYEIPMVLGQRNIVISDSKAIAHFFSKSSWTYTLGQAEKIVLAKAIGKGVVWADGELHRMQRRSLALAFNSTSIRKLSSFFYDSSHKLKNAWEAIIDAEGNDGNSGAIIEIQNWMNRITLDTIGLACFSYNFASLDGEKSPIISAFDAIGARPSATAINFLLVMRRFPFVFHLPSYSGGLVNELHKAATDVSNNLFEKVKEEKKEGSYDGKGDCSIIGLLIKLEDAENNKRLTREEILAQIMNLLVAGYQTTATTLTWALLELALHPDVQRKLREEILTFDEEPTYDQLSKDFPYLDAVLHEVFRLHPSSSTFPRMAIEDDVIPLSEPVHTKSGGVTHDIFVPRGTFVTVPSTFINYLEALWGPDAKQFRPERWLEKDGIPPQARELQGHRHLMTFGDGPRICPGKLFAIAEIKTVLWVVVRNFVLETRDGLDTKVDRGRGMLPRPGLVGEMNANVPLRIKRYCD